MSKLGGAVDALSVEMWHYNQQQMVGTQCCCARHECCCVVCTALPYGTACMLRLRWVLNFSRCVKGVVCCKQRLLATDCLNMR